MLSESTPGTCQSQAPRCLAWEVPAHNGFDPAGSYDLPSIVLAAIVGNPQLQLTAADAIDDDEEGQAHLVQQLGKSRLETADVTNHRWGALHLAHARVSATCPPRPAPRVRRKPPVPSLTPFAPTPRSSWQATMADEHDEPMEVAGDVARRRCLQQKLLLK